MSKKLAKAKWYLCLLLHPHTPEAQIKSLLKTASDFQIIALSEIAHNLLYGNLPISSRAKNLIHSHRNILGKLADKKQNLDAKAKFIKHNLRIIFNCIFVSRQFLLSLLV